VPAGTVKRIRLTITPKSGYHAKQVRLPIRVFCANAAEPAGARGETVTLSF